METGRNQAFALIEPMGVYTLLARVEVKLSSSLRTSVLGKPGQQGGSEPAGTNLRKSDKVINV
jgi:hypothetical protein